MAIARGAIDGASAGGALSRALAASSLQHLLAVPLHVIAAGKAASTMAATLAAENQFTIKTLLAVGTHRHEPMPSLGEWIESAHPVPDDRSVTAARRALDIASGVAADQCLVLLLSGGASALMALPAQGVSLEEKQQTIRTMMLAGADIQALNTVRKHLSAIKGGRLAAACQGRTLTLAVSDVIGDDLSIIGSGPGVADMSTYIDASGALDRFGGTHHLRGVRDYIARGVRGEVAETPKPGDAGVRRATARVIASRPDAIAGAQRTAESLGYVVFVLSEEVAGESREAAHRWFARAMDRARHTRSPVCVMSAGETTVQVSGRGRGGRNQEFVLALTDAVAAASRPVIVTSVGTDGIDGPTDAAGAIVDCSSASRAQALGLTPRVFLEDNNSYEFFDRIGDLIRLGRTDTNVGDLQLLLASGESPP